MSSKRSNPSNRFAGGRQAAVFVASVLDRYRLHPTRLLRVNESHNSTWRIEDARGRRFVLKIHRPTERIDAIRSEMQWLDALSSETDLLVPRPIRNRDGELITVLDDGRPCRMMTWVHGVRRGRSMRTKHLESLGELMARLHLHAMQFKRPRGFYRPTFGRERLLVRLTTLRTSHKQRAITRAQLNVFERATKLGLAAMRRLGTGREVFGLIHGDLCYGNQIYDRTGRAGAIDFEAGGFGYFLEDIVEPFALAQHVPRIDKLCEDVLRGYRTVRALPDEHARLIPAFVTVSIVTTCGYIAGEPTRRAEIGDFAKYAQKHLPRVFSAATRRER